MKTVLLYLMIFSINSSVAFSQVTSEVILIKNDSIELPGTLTFTENNSKLIIWIHGSGNVDRDGNQAGLNVKANYIKQFRDSINKNDIAFFSYDKRTANLKNKKFFKGITFDAFIADAKKVVSHFKNNTRFKKIVLIGHSQGSLIAMLASAEVDKYISLAGPSETIDATIIKQISKQNAELGKITAAYFKELKETGDIKEVNPMLLSIFAKPNRAFIASWMQYKPSVEFKQLKIPTLVINGIKDLQVSVEDAKALYSANPNSELVLIEDMNHILKHIENNTDNIRSYHSPDFPISTKLIEVITQFVKK
ncbi:MAG: alpha/beta hydrolase [Flavobacteriaceae bacterium]|nr:MAG: alpha/beta hydrolase [Flavobacteriaceae bacterium]